MPNTIRLTLPLINACRTAKGGFTGATVRAFGLVWADIERGWVRRLIGTYISRSNYEQALAGRSTQKEKRRERRSDTAKRQTAFDFAGSTPATIAAEVIRISPHRPQPKHA